MGYMGLDHWIDSDNASDFRSKVEDVIANVFAKHLDYTSNEYNTPGAVNVALVAEELLFRDGEPVYLYSEGHLYSVIVKCYEMLTESIEKVEMDEKHLKCFTRMQNSMNEIIKRNK